MFSASQYLDCAVPAAVLQRGSSNQPHKLHWLQLALPAWTLLQRAHGSLIIPFLTSEACGTIQQPVLPPHSQHNLHHTSQGHTCIINTQLIQNCGTDQHNITQIIVMSVSTKLHLHRISKKFRNKANVSFLCFLRPMERKQFWGVKKC